MWSNNHLLVLTFIEHTICNIFGPNTKVGHLHGAHVLTAHGRRSRCRVLGNLHLRPHEEKWSEKEFFHFFIIDFLELPDALLPLDRDPPIFEEYPLDNPRDPVEPCTIPNMQVTTVRSTPFKNCTQHLDRHHLKTTLSTTKISETCQYQKETSYKIVPASSILKLIHMKFHMDRLHSASCKQGWCTYIFPLWPADQMQSKALGQLGATKHASHTVVVLVQSWGVHCDGTNIGYHSHDPSGYTGLGRQTHINHPCFSSPQNRNLKIISFVRVSFWSTAHAQDPEWCPFPMEQQKDQMGEPFR